MIVSDFTWHKNEKPLLEVDPVELPHLFRVWRDFRCSFKLDGIDTVLTIPAGTITDLASVPRIVFTIVPPFGAYTAAAVVHDFLCIKKLWTNLVAADIMFEAMRASRVAESTRLAIYNAVVLGGPKW